MRETFFTNLRGGLAVCGARVELVATPRKDSFAAVGICGVRCGFAAVAIGVALVLRPTNTKVLPIPSYNCCASALLLNSHRREAHWWVCERTVKTT